MRARPRNHLEADLGFHSAIAAASHNQLLETLLQPLVETIQQGIEANYHLGRVAIQQGMEGHEEIWAAIAARRPDAAAAAMQRHLAVSERQLSLALHLEPDAPDSDQ
jgi:GntR family transcriptional repressor for pyruvate dehydrogenase complex